MFITTNVESLLLRTSIKLLEYLLNIYRIMSIVERL